MEMFGYYTFNCYKGLNDKENDKKVEEKNDASYLCIMPFVFSFKYKEIIDKKKSSGVLR
jgi:hypothetical protein